MLTLAQSRMHDQKIVDSRSALSSRHPVSQILENPSNEMYLCKYFVSCNRSRVSFSTSVHVFALSSSRGTLRERQEASPVSHASNTVICSASPEFSENVTAFASD